MSLTKWLPPTHRHTVGADLDRVTWLELFFDLVYVAALIQLGDQLSGDVSWGGVGRFAAVFALLWWTWTGTTTYTNRFAVDDVLHRALVFAQMFAVASVALLAVGPNEERWKWLAIAYVAARIPMILMYVRVLPVGGDTTALGRLYLIAFSIGSGLFAVSIFVDEPTRFVIWAVAIAIEFITPMVAVGRQSGPPMHDHHLRERYAIFAIIVFGETFVKTLTQLASQGVSTVSMGFLGLVFVAAIGLWWTYFDDVAESSIRRGSRWHRVVWVYGHLPLTAALTAFGVGSKKIIALESFDAAIYPSYLWLFGGSIAAVLIFTAVLDFVTVSPHFAVKATARIAAPLLAAVAVLVTISLVNSPAILVVGLIVAAVVAQMAAEVAIAMKADAVVAARIRSDLDQAAEGCQHLSDLAPLPAPAHPVCPACIELDLQWVELRQCQSCGHIGCCDDSEGRHARAHWGETRHPVIATIEHGDSWAYCYADDATEDGWAAGREPAADH